MIDEETDDEFEVISTGTVESPEDSKEKESQEPKREEPKVSKEDSRSELSEEAKKVYVTRHGEAYHQTEDCKTLKHSQIFRREPCEICKERVKEMWKEKTASSSHERNKMEVIITNTNTKYHHPSCEELKKCKAHDKRRMCWYCNNEKKEPEVWNKKSMA